MSELPSMSLYLDKKLTVNVVPGEVVGESGHLITMWSIPDREYANTPPGDLWDFYIKQRLDALAEKINSGGDFCTRSLPLPPKGAGAIGFLSADGKVPVRLLIGRRQSDESGPSRHLFILDLFAYTPGE